MGEAPVGPRDRVATAVLGFPRFGRDRELKRALERRWSGEGGDEELLETARAIRSGHRAAARAAGIDAIPCNDFSLYDHVLDAALTAGLVAPPAPGLDGYFALARGGGDHRPLEMTKWFDTNYHYLVPELDPARPPALDPTKPVAELGEAARDGIAARTVLLGPVTLLRLSKSRDPRVRPLDLLEPLVAVYRELLSALRRAGATAVQLDEPCLVQDLEPRELDAAESALAALAEAEPRLSLCVATYFGDLGPALDRVLDLPVAELHLDLVRGARQLGPALRRAAAGRGRLSLGVVDGRNVWVTDPERALTQIDAALAALGRERVVLAPSCSLLHVPYAVARETALDPEVRGWLAFGDEKLAELGTLAHAALTSGPERVELIAPMAAAVGGRRGSPRTRRPDVRERLAALEGDRPRATPVGRRLELQRRALGLPELPTTTIGSFPQTAAIRAARGRLRSGELSPAAYRRLMEDEIRRVVAWQEDAGLDVLVHGEPERNDMVQYFAEMLDGFAVTEHGWVQSYGSRGVKPPILFGDVSRSRPMTVPWWRTAQAVTARPVKGMLTGPVTMLAWSFVRDDQPEPETARQVALAIRDEVADLERAGARIVQIDEAAFRERLPLRRADQPEYLRWAVAAFRLCSSGVADETQIHSHMCYSEFNEVMEHIAALDADVISIEASRSGMELLDAFRRVDYPGAVGPGVYDIHSPRVPTADEIADLLALAEERIPRGRLWVNPDCGLKTRSWDEVAPAIANMVEAARRRRATVAAGAR